MKQIKNFVKHTFKHLPKEDKQKVIDYVSELLTEKVDDLIENGYTQQDAIDKAVIEFGTVEDYYDEEHHSVRPPKTTKQYQNDFVFSLLGALIIIGMLIFSNLQYTPKTIWFVLPTLAVLWWPLALFYRFMNKRNQEDSNE
jgi:hypothetical protein